MKKGISSLALFLVMVLMTRPLIADVYNIQFAGYDGNPAHGLTPAWIGGGSPSVDPGLFAGTGEGTWNRLFADATTNPTYLATGTGSTSTVQFTYNQNFQGWTWGKNGFTGTGYSGLLDTSVFSSNNQLTNFAFTGLTPGKTYTMYILSQAIQGGDDQLAINYGSTHSQLVNYDTNTNLLIQGQNYLEIPVTVDASGDIKFSTIALSSNANLNGIQLVGSSSSSAPEPSTYILMGIGGVLVALRLKKSGKGSTFSA